MKYSNSTVFIYLVFWPLATLAWQSPDMAVITAGRGGRVTYMSASVTAWKILEESVGRYQSLFMAYLSIMTNVFAFTEWTLQAILGTGCWKRAILGRASLSLESGPDSAFYWFLLWTLDGRPCSELMSSSADKINTQNSGCVTVLLLLYFKWTKWIKHINTNTLSNRVEEWTWGQYPTYFIYL